MSRKRKLEKDDGVFAVPKPKRVRRDSYSATQATNIPPVPTFRVRDLSYDIEWYGGSDKGKKAHMEDRRLEIPSLSKKSTSPYFAKSQCALFGILDGHGGSKVVTYLQSHLPNVFLEQFDKYVVNSNTPNPNNTTHSASSSSNSTSRSSTNNTSLANPIQDSEVTVLSVVNGDGPVSGVKKEEGKDDEKNSHNLNIQKALHATFKMADRKILDWISPMKREGSTGTLVFFHNRTIWSAGIGDTKAVLARKSKKNGKLRPLQLTKDHTVLQLSEVKRIESCGGRVANGRVNGILEVTRSFGDPEFKKCGVIAVPQISKFELCDRDEFLIIACDGLWSVFSVSDCVSFVKEKLEHKSKPDVQEVVRQLLAEAILNKHAKDNVSAIVIKFKH